MPSLTRAYVKAAKDFITIVNNLLRPELAPRARVMLPHEVARIGGRVAMRDPAVYLKFAEECLALANTAAPERRAILLEMAQAWRSLAHETERHSRSVREKSDR